MIGAVFLTRARGSCGLARRWWRLAPAVDEWGGGPSHCSFGMLLPRREGQVRTNGFGVVEGGVDAEGDARRNLTPATTAKKSKFL